MLSKEKYVTYVNLLKEELVPAMGCTEPISIAYAVAKTKNVLGEAPKKGVLEVSANIIKNAKSVTVPNTGGMKGIKTAFCAGLVGDADAELQTLSKVNESQIEEIKNGWLDFDLIITTPKFMPELSKLGKILGPRGLMPNPKTQTVTNDIKSTAAEFKKGRFEYRTDSYGNIHSVIGKASFSSEQLAQNIKAMIDIIKTKRPSTVKGDFLQNVVISPSMGPAIKVKFN